MAGIDAAAIEKMSEEDLSALLSKISADALSRADKENLLDSLSDHISKRRFGKAFNLVITWAHLFSNRDLDSLKLMTQLIMYPTNNPADDKFEALVARLCACPLLVSVRTWHKKLESIQNYAKIWHSLAKEETEIIKVLKKYNTQVIKALLANAERGFLTRNIATEFKYKFTGPGSYIGKERVAYAASILLRRYGQKVLLGQSLDVPLLSTYEKEVPLIFHFLDSLDKLIEFGIKIAYLDFECRFDGKLFSFVPTDKVLDMALAYGYAKNEMQAMASAASDKDAAVDFRDTVAEFMRRYADKDFVKIVGEGPLTRIRLEMPRPVLKLLYEKIFGVEQYFQDEYFALKEICDEFYTSFGELSKFKISPNLRLIDAYHIIRILRFIAYMRDPKLEEIEKADELALLNSMLIIYPPKELFVEHLVDFGINKTVAEEFQSFFSVPADNPGDTFDLQYQPMITNRKKMFLFPNILSHSNLFRNALVKAKKRFVGGDNKAKLEEIIKANISESTNKIKTDVEYKFKGIVGEIDVIFKLGETIFVFECKDLLLPCSSFELRSYYEQIEKGISQILKTQAFFSDREFRKLISSKIGWEIPDGARFSYGVITGGRLFSGADKEGVPIRGLKELINVISGGKIYFSGTDGTRDEISIWKSDKLSDEDLIAYLSKESLIYSSIWKNATAYQFQLKFKDVAVEYTDYGFDIIKNARDMGVSEATLKGLEKKMEEIAKRQSDSSVKS